MNYFEQYGIKEVADVAFYDTETKAPVIFFDTLKVSTIDETAQQVAATGGKGNASLIIWDFGKEITLNIEDALFSMKSMALMHGGALGKTANVQQTTSFRVQDDGSIPATKNIPATALFYNDKEQEVQQADFNPGDIYIATWVEAVTGGADTITITAEDFPGTYEVIGDTWARNRNTGKDEAFQFVIPRAKVGSERSITMQAEGDPSTFPMTLTVLRPEDGVMMKFIKYPLTSVSPEPVPVTSVSLDQTAATIAIGGSVTLTATVLPTNATNKEIIWSSSNMGVATVSGGVVTGVSAGSSDITATTADGGFIATCTLTVTATVVGVTGVTLDQDTLALEIGVTDTGTLVATVAPADATDKSLTWDSDDDTVATVDAAGEVTAVAAGTATITVTTNDGSFTDTCEVTVS